MKKLLSILFFIFITQISYGQAVFTQTFVDRCTGDVKVVTANFVNGSATVAFYNRVRTFTFAEYTNGQLQQWLVETYTWWNSLSPCSTATQQAQQAQQTAQTAAQAASTASTAASTASTAATQATQTTTGGTTNGTSQSTNSSSNNSNSSSSTESTKSEGGSGSGETKSEGGGETSEGGGESESKTEESKEEEVKEEKKEEESSEGDSEEKKEEKEEKKKREMLPIQLRADMMVNQALLGNYDLVTSIGATQSSIFGDVTYGATAMVWSNLRQLSINGSYTKVNMEKFDLSTISHDGHTHYSKTKNVTVNDPTSPPIPKISNIESASIGYMNNFGNGTIVISYNKLKPMEKWGTAGIGVNIANNFAEGKYQNSIVGYNILYTNMIMITPKIQYAPAFIWTQSPYIGKFDLKNELSGQRAYGMMILSNSFTIQLTRRFSFNAGATFIKSADPTFPLIKSFMIGTKLPF